jgi:beta-lactamase class A
MMAQRTETQQQVDWSAIEQIIANAEKRGGIVGATIIAPNADSFEYNGDRRFKAASTVKIPIMIEIFRQIEAGKRSLDDRYTLHDNAKAPGSGILLHLHDGIELTVYDLLYLMISISDNTATNILIDMAGMDAVNNVMRELGMTNSTLGRKMLNRAAQGEEHENWATSNDYATVVQAVLDDRAASPDSCKQMIALLEKQQNRRRISRHLPEDEKIRWGTKTGSIKGVTNDAGFIMANGQTLIVSVYCEGFPDQHIGEEIIGDISRAAMRATGIVEPLDH